MNNTAHKTPAASPNRAKHLSRLESTAPKRNPGARPQNINRTPSVTDAPQPEPEKTPKRKSKWWIWLIVGLVVAIAGVASYFLFFHKGTTLAAAEQPEEEVLVYGLETPLIFENDQAAFFVDAVGEKGDYLELDVRCVNKTNDTLSFTWNSTCINGSMFDPLWNVYVQSNSTLRSSITFPLSTLSSYNLLPANQIQFVMAVFNETQYERMVYESQQHIAYVVDTSVSSRYHQKFKGYDNYRFDGNVSADKDGRPYYVDDNDTVVYFDEIYDRNGQPMYPSNADYADHLSFYNDDLGRPYYFSDSSETVYYDGYGFAFYDADCKRCYFYDENGIPSYYGNNGVPEPYERIVIPACLFAKRPNALQKSQSSYIVHKEFTIYPTGKTAEEISIPERATAKTEQVYWNGEKGNFIVLGGELDEFKGYVVQTYIENDSDRYIYLGWQNVVVNGIYTHPDTITVLRPHSTAYRDVIIPNQVLMDNEIQVVSEIDFSVYAVGENLSVPLYPIEWLAPTSTQTRR